MARDISPNEFKADICDINELSNTCHICGELDIENHQCPPGAVEAWNIFEHNLLNEITKQVS